MRKVGRKAAGRPGHSNPNLPQRAKRFGRAYKGSSWFILREVPRGVASHACLLVCSQPASGAGGKAACHACHAAAAATCLMDNGIVVGKMCSKSQEETIGMKREGGSQAAKQTSVFHHQAHWET